MAIACALAALAGLLAAQSGATVPVGFQDDAMANLSAPTAMAFTPDGRALITTSPGVLRVYQNGALVTLPALNLGTKVCTERERGLLGVVADPDFATNHYIYLYYTFNKTGTCTLDGDPANSPVNRMSRFVLGDDNVVDPASEHVLLDNIPAFAGYHNAGDLHFGPDGYLYVSVGDGGCYYRDPTLCGVRNGAGQDLSDMQGNILRITKTGGIPPGNPYTGAGTTQCALIGYTTQGTKCQEVYAYGLRNPFRFTFDPNTPGRFFINDVGSNNWEEVNQGAKGANYGWPVREGLCNGGSFTDCPATPAGMTDPVYTYSHQNPDGCASVTAGSFVPNGLWPTAYDDNYVFGDFVCGKSWTLSPSAPGGTVSDFATGIGPIVGMVFGPGPSAAQPQSLWYLVRSPSTQIRRITYTGSSNRRPVAQASADQTSSDTVPFTVNFDGSKSSDADNDSLTYDWDFGDGSSHSSAVSPAHTYDTAGRYFAKLTVSDPNGASDSATIQIDAGNRPPAPVIDTPAPNLQFYVGQKITLTGHATDIQDGDVPDASLSWEVHLHHNTHYHPFLQPTPGNGVVITAPSPEDLTAADTSYLEVFLTATDSKGLSRTVEQDIQPHKVPLTIDTDPSGLQAGANELTLAGPTTVNAWQAQQIDLAADTQTYNGETYEFDSWSDGGAAHHSISMPASAKTYTATFASTSSHVGVSGSSLGFSAGVGVANDVSVARNVDGSFTVTDANAPITPDAGCQSVLSNSVSCDGTGVTGVSVKARDGDDKVKVTGSVPATIDGGQGNDTITGGQGDDTIDGGAGADTIKGDLGTDTATYASRTQPVTVRLNGKADDGEAGENDQVSSDVENVIGGSGNDSLIGNGGANGFNGGPGDDLIEPQGGQDTIAGGTGTDRVSYLDHTANVSVTLDGVRNDGSAGENDLVMSDVEGAYGGAGNDTLVGDDGPNLLKGYGGQDTIDGKLGADQIYGGDDYDTATYASRSQPVTLKLDGKANDGEVGENDLVWSDVENLTGGTNADTLIGNSNQNRLDGGPGDDYLEPQTGKDDVVGGTGTDRVSYLGRTAGVNVSLDSTANDGESGENDLVEGDVESVYGGEGNDTLTGDGNANALRSQGGADTIDGGGGDDTLDGGLGTDTINGGTGSDTATYDTRTTAVTVRLNGKADDGASGENDLVSADIENVRGGSGGDSLIGNSGANKLFGGSGDDYLEPQGGQDDVSGGGGTGDRVSYTGSTVPVDVSLDGVANDGAAGENDLVESDVEGAYGGSAGDKLTGDGNANLLRGFDGNDTISGGGGDDTIDGGLGTDTMNGGSGVDMVTYESRADGTPLTIRLNGKADDGAAGENDLIGSDVENARGGNGNDALVGNDGPNKLNGGPGDDVIEPQKGKDDVIGGLGSNDRVSYIGRTAAVNVSLDNVANDGEPGEGDLVEGDVEGIRGGNGNDTLTGNGYANPVLDGQGGNDTIDGRQGKDTVTGGAGSDTIFSYDSEVDSVACGADSDTVTADTGDSVNADCESVTRQ